MSTVVDLETLDTHDLRVGGDGAGITGSSTVAVIGDINGDGFDDFIIGAPYANYVGAAYVIFGRAGGPGTIDLTHLQPADEFLVLGGSNAIHAGSSVSGAGDVNGDGFDDFIVAASNASFYYTSGASTAYLIFGHAGAFGTIDLGNLAPSAGFTITGEVSGISVASAGDINGDGFDDIIVGQSDENGGRGAAYVIFGGHGLGPITLHDLLPGNSGNGTRGFVIVGANPGDHAGFSVASIGDINGDHIDDIIIGAPAIFGPPTRPGTAYVIFGRAGHFDPSVNLANLPATTGFAIIGSTPGDLAGFSVSAAGDINGDGFNDFIIGAHLANRAYVIFGHAGAFTTINLSNPPPGSGFVIQGHDDFAGISVSAAGDVNGDGFADLIVGAPDSDIGATNSGAAYVIFGHAGSFSTIDLANLSSSAGVILRGHAAGDFAGSRLAGGGDLNHDGLADLIIDVPGSDHFAGDAGEVVVVFGRPSLGFQFGPAQLLLRAFGGSSGAGGWASDDRYPRVLADVNGDGRADIVGFGEAGVFVSLANSGTGFSPATLVLGAFGASVAAGGWTSNDRNPRMLADVNGDGRADIVAFGDNEVFVALGNANGTFAPVHVATTQFGVSAAAGGWSSQDAFPRVLADVNGDGRADIVGFGQHEVYVALGNADGTFAAAQVASTQFGAGAGAGGWTSDDRYPRFVVDVNGDHWADIVGFGENGVYVALANGNGTFGPAQLVANEFGAAGALGGWASEDRFPRALADIDGDGRVDVVGFGQAGVYVAFGNGNGTFQRAVLHDADFGAGGGWSSEDHFPRFVADINHDGAADIVGFGDAGVYVAYSNGDIFAA